MATVKGQLVLFVFFVLSLMQKAAGRCLLVEADSNKSSPAGSLHLDVSPSQITPGLTDSLSLNCTFSSSQDSDVYTIMSLIVSKSVYKENQQESQEDQYMDLVSLNIFTPDEVNELNEVNGSVTGHIDPSGDSYLMITWSYPTSDQGGHFKCEVHGMNSAGHSMEMFQTCVVTLQQPNFDQILSKVSDLQKQLDRQENLARNQSDVITMLQSELNNHSATILSMKEMLQVVGPFYCSSEYLGHRYLLSKFKNRSNEAQIECRKYGGYLVNIHDDTEYQFVKKFVDHYSDYGYVWISGTDEGHEGRWTYSGTYYSLSFTAWITGKPGTSQSDNCILMYRSDQWRWADYPCGSSQKFMCEIEME